jgi:hypothetical protein
MTPEGVILLAATMLALAVRLFTLSRSGYLTGVTEYDDGVYLGGAIRLLQGIIPYHDYAYVQPPGILLLMAPVALLTKVTTATHTMAVARILTALASTACVPLAGSLVRHRGPLVTLVTSGFLAVYPDSITTAHTLILEPWMNLLVLAGACVAFRDGRLAAPRWLLWAGILIGFAGAVKYWAGLPALVVLIACLMTAQSRRQRTLRFTAGVAIGFLVPILPFALISPVTYVRSTLLDQASRAGSYVARSVRLAHITGLIDFLNGRGQLSVFAGTHSMFASGGAAATPGTSAGMLPYAVTAIAIIAVAAGYVLRPGRPSALEWVSMVTAVGATAAIMLYSAFFYHYPEFGAPWIAIVVGGAFGVFSGHRAATGDDGPRDAPWRERLRGRFPGGNPGRAQRPVIAVIALGLLLLAAFQAREMAGLAAPDVYPDQAVIPAGSCVVSDQVSMTLAVNRFTQMPGDCPVILDSLAETLVLSNGVSVQGGVTSLPHVVAAWQQIFARADYVWLSPNNGRRIPWTPGLRTWFSAHFIQLPVQGGLGKVYQRVPG